MKKKASRAPQKPTKPTKAEPRKAPSRRDLVTNARELATLLGVHRNTVANWMREGLPVMGRSGRDVELDLATALQWIRARDLKAFDAKLEAAMSNPNLDRERYRKLRAEADMAEMDRDRKRGELVSQTDAERIWATHVLQVRARLLSLPAHARVRGVAAEAVDVVEELIRRALESLSHVDDAEAGADDEAIAS